MASDPKSSAFRFWRVLLVISLAMNVAVIGLVAGFAWRKDRVGPPHGISLTLGPIGSALSREDRRELVEDLRADPRLRPHRRGDDLDAILAALRADPFDRATLQGAMSAMTARKDRLQEAAREALIERVTLMSDADRIAFADRLERGFKRR